MSSLKKLDECHHSVTLISANEIRKEMEGQGYAADKNTVCLIAEARIKTALLSGADVVYDASNIYESIRKKILEIAKEVGVDNTELYITPMNRESSRTDINTERLSILKQAFLENYPTTDEGWNHIVDSNKDFIPA